MYRVVNPATNAVEAEYPTATPAEVATAVAASDEAYRAWSATPLAHRSAVLHAVADAYARDAESLAAVITREMGKTTADALGEIDSVVEIYRYYAERGPALLADEVLATSDGAHALVRKAPIGPLLGIMPWNYPYYQVARFAAPNLMAGNTVLLKPAPQCPQSALAMDAIFTEAGLPPGVYATVLATNEQVAEVIADPRVRGVSVTGSERAGTAVAALAGAHLKKVVLELGGSDPYLVLATDDLDAVVEESVLGRMENAGQACNAAKRFIVADDLYENFVDALTERMSALSTGDPTDPATSFGPLASEAAAQTLAGQVADAVERGARVRTGGGRPARPGAFFEATVLTDVTPAMRAYHEELFGPVAVVYRAGSLDEAVALANATPFGLGGAVFHTDPATAMAVADQLDTGMVFINQGEGGGAELPFGGTKRSGVGRELGPYGIDEFINRKLIHRPVD